MYQTTIREEAERLGIQVDPRHVEAWMRLEWGTLSARPRSDFARYVRITQQVEEQHPGESEPLAQSFGL